MKKYYLIIIALLVSLSSCTQKYGVYEVTAEQLNAYDSPSQTGNVIKVYSKGEQFRIYAMIDDWSMISRIDNVEKWVETQHIKWLSGEKMVTKREQSIFNVFKFMEVDVKLPEFNSLIHFGRSIHIESRVYMLIFALISILLIVLGGIGFHRKTGFPEIYTVIMLLTSIYLIIYFLSTDDPTWFCDPDDIGWGYTIINFILFSIFIIAWTFNYTLQFDISSVVFCTNANLYLSFISILITPIVIKIMTWVNLGQYFYIVIAILGLVNLWAFIRLIIMSFGRFRFISAILHMSVFLITTIATLCIASLFIPLLIVAVAIVVCILSLGHIGERGSSPTMTIQNELGITSTLEYRGGGVWGNHTGRYRNTSGNTMTKI